MKARYQQKDPRQPEELKTSPVRPLPGVGLDHVPYPEKQYTGALSATLKTKKDSAVRKHSLKASEQHDPKGLEALATSLLGPPK